MPAFLHPLSPSSSETYIDFPSPTQKAGPRPHFYMNNNEHYTSSGSETHLRRTDDDFNVLAESTSFLSRAPAISNDTNIPVHILKDAIAAQYATCEKYRHRVLSTMWEIEESKRWSLVSEHTLRGLKDKHAASELALQSWVECLENEVKKSSIASLNSADRNNAEKGVLGCVESQFDRLERLAIARGLTDEDLGMLDDADSSDSQG
ncbi:hypothetical protein AZE42_10185 [Rhizopogon vesiculosus]|uniref:Uncharacterized protein n=1 Tax=Rhizopogon vesiculosus TaxID=180088 RepID=A0A1J8PSJ9_9AGAM|nr:hypothetical protein AZE42_10185 [Rhizopogon vesiculosus]